jgi:flagella basal body P-ring formation protein FlgA
MSSFARLALVVLLAAPVAAQVPAPLRLRVQREVARTWGTDTAGLVLRFGSGAPADRGDSTVIRLLGRGDGGWFAVTFEAAGHPPAALRLRAGTATERIVASRPLRVGARLAEGDLRSEPTVRWGPPDESPTVTPTVGWVVRRVLAAGDPMDPSRVSAPPAVTSGDPMRLWWREGSVAVALEGTALNDAPVGGRVRVRTSQRARVLVGTVSAAGEARMN